MLNITYEAQDECPIKVTDHFKKSGLFFDSERACIK